MPAAVIRTSVTWLDRFTRGLSGGRALPCVTWVGRFIRQLPRVRPSSVRDRRGAERAGRERGQSEPNRRREVAGRDALRKIGYRDSHHEINDELYGQSNHAP